MYCHSVFIRHAKLIACTGVKTTLISRINYIACIVYPTSEHGPLTRYVKLRVAHAPRMPGTFSPPPRVSVTHVPWCMSGSLTSSFPWSRWRGKHSRHSRRMRNPQFCVSGKRPMAPSSKRGACRAYSSRMSYLTSVSLCSVPHWPYNTAVLFASVWSQEAIKPDHVTSLLSSSTMVLEPMKAMTKKNSSG